MNAARFPFRRFLGLAVVVAALPAGTRANSLAWQSSLSMPAYGVGGTTVTVSVSVENNSEAAWGSDHYLALQDGQGLAATPPSLDGIEPGGSITVSFALTLPTTAGTYTYYLQGVEYGVEYFGEVQSCTITVTAPPPATPVTLSATSFRTAALPTIASTDSIVQASYYRLRAKVNDGSSTGYHAAVSWNNQNLSIDSAPPAGNYGVCALYWVRYDNWCGNALQIGPETFTPLSVTGGTVRLSTYTFGGANPARVITDEPMGSATAYRLFATLSNAQGATFETAGGLNNNNAALTGLPPPGEYPVTLYWKKYDTSGTVFETSPVFPAPAKVTITGGPIQVLNSGGYIFGTSWENPDDGSSGTDYSSGGFWFQVPVAGVLKINTTELPGTWGYVLRPDWSSAADGSHEITAYVAPGWHYALVTAEADGNYQVFGTLTPSSPPPVISSAATADGTVGGPFTFQITATNGATSFGAYSLPPGLSVNPSNGLISGTPTTAGIHNVVAMATNSSGPGGQWLTITIAKATPVLKAGTFPDRSFDAPSLTFTTDMLNATFVDPTTGASVPTPSVVTYSMVWWYDGSVVNPIGKNLNRFHATAVVTATCPSSTDYNSATATATFRVTDTTPPTAPPGLTATVLGPTGVGLQWQPSVDNFLVKRYEIDVGDGRPLLKTTDATEQSPTTPTTIVINGLNPGSTYTIEVRAVDYFGLPSASASVAVTTPAAGTSPVPSPQWDDIDGDGLRDEIFSAGPSVFAIYEIETSTAEVTRSFWTWEYVGAFGLDYGDAWNFYVGGYWTPVMNDETYTVDVVRPGFQVLAEPGYDYSVIWNVTRSNGQLARATLIPRSNPPLVSATATSSAIHDLITAPMLPADAFWHSAFPTTLVRYGKSASGIQLNLPIIGNVTLRAGSGGVSGSVVLPGNMQVTAGNGAASVTAPGVGTVTVHNGGGVSGSLGPLPGGWVLTGTSNGQITLSGPGGASLSSTPGGTTVSLPGSTAVTVNAAGAISLSVPGGTGALMGNAVDVLGQLLGVGTGVGSVRGQITLPGVQTSQSAWEDIRYILLGNLPPGEYEIVTTTDTRGMPESPTPPAPANVFRIRLIVQAPPPPRIAVDVNRDGTITFDSGDATSAAEPYRFWINDDDDSGDLGGDDIPGKTTGANYADGVVNGTRDLVDFFPVFLDLKQLLPALPPSASVKYKLKQADNALNLVYTDLARDPTATRDGALAYLKKIFTTGFGPDFTQAAGAATTQQITAAGIELSSAFLTRVKDSDWGVLLLEGRAVTTAPLVLSVEKDGTTMAEVKLELRISNVEDMFRHIDLTDAARAYNGAAVAPPVPASPTRSGDPGAPYPDSATNGKYFVFVHGFNINGQRARGWSAEVFKRLYQMGSRARFVGLTWNGATGVQLPNGSYTDYHQAVFQAFQTGDELTARLTSNGVTGDVTIAAHSLGNMVASQAIQYGGFSPTRYYMINGAVPVESYHLGSVGPGDLARMTNVGWKNPPLSNGSGRLFAANWYLLFSGTGDHRSELTWKQRFPNVVPLAHNFYSPGDEVVEDPMTSSSSLLLTVINQGFTSAHGAWGLQELAKGTFSIASAFFSRTQAGWGESGYSISQPEDANPSDASLKVQPFFASFYESDLTNSNATVASTKAGLKNVQYDLLARGIPALSFATAVHRLFPLDDTGRNFNMESDGRTQNQWPIEGHTNDPRDAGRWLHSDFKNVALPYVFKMYQEMISRGSLQ